MNCQEVSCKMLNLKCPKWIQVIFDVVHSFYSLITTNFLFSEIYFLIRIRKTTAIIAMIVMTLIIMVIIIFM